MFVTVLKGYVTYPPQHLYYVFSIFYGLFSVHARPNRTYKLFASTLPQVIVIHQSNGLANHQELFARISFELRSYLSNGTHARCKLFASPPAHTLSILISIRFSFTLTTPPRGAQVCLGWPFPAWFVAREWVSLCGATESGLWWLYPLHEEKETPTRVAQKVWQSSYREWKDITRLQS